MHNFCIMNIICFTFDLIFYLLSKLTCMYYFIFKRKNCFDVISDENQNHIVAGFRSLSTKNEQFIHSPCYWCEWTKQETQ
jgi:hypothetical protein